MKRIKSGLLCCPAQCAPVKSDVMRFIICIGLLLQTIFVFAQSEPYTFSKLDIYTGLSHNQVSCILKDTDGFLWFGTISGLNRYDGYSCKIFRNKHDDSTSLNDNSINSLYELPGGKMWVGTGKGPCIYDSMDCICMPVREKK